MFYLETVGIFIIFKLAKFLNISEFRLSITLKNNIFNINEFEIIKI